MVLHYFCSVCVTVVSTGHDLKSDYIMLVTTQIIWSNYFCIEVRVQARIYVSRLGIYNYCLRFYSIFAFFFLFFPRNGLSQSWWKRGGCSCSLLRNENVEDFRDYWLETCNHGMLELEGRGGGGEETFWILSIDSIFESTERNLVIYPLEYRIWFDGYAVFSWYFVTIKVTSAMSFYQYQHISTGLMNFFLHEYAALLYEGRWPQIGSTYRSLLRKSSEAQIFVINRKMLYVVMCSHLA